MTDLYDAADVYDLQYEAYRDDVPFYLNLAADEGGPVLELGSGTGRLTAALAASGAPVTGVELSPAMLDAARQRVPASAKLLHGDIRQLEQLPLEPGSFALVMAPFNVLMHLHTLDDQDAALSGAYRLLQPGGLFALDLYMPRFGPEQVLRAVPEWAHVAGPGGQVLLLQEHSELNQLVTSTYLIDTPDGSGLIRRRTVKLTQRYFQPFELQRALRAAGFGQIRMFGGFDRSRFGAGSSHMAVTCRRPSV